MLWNGYAGKTGGVGGALGWDGELRLHVSHRDRVSEMACDMLGQKKELAARESIIDTPWWAAWSAWRTRLRRVGGITTRSL